MVEYNILGYKTLIHEADGYLFGRVLKLDNCIAGGKTIEELKTNLNRAVTQWIEKAQSEEKVIPPKDVPDKIELQTITVEDVDIKNNDTTTMDLIVGILIDLTEIKHINIDLGEEAYSFGLNLGYVHTSMEEKYAVLGKKIKTIKNCIIDVSDLCYKTNSTKGLIELNEHKELINKFLHKFKLSNEVEIKHYIVEHVMYD